MLAGSRGLARRLLCTSRTLSCKEKNREVPSPDEAGWAFNHVEKKQGMYKPRHSIEEQLEYMKSKAFHDAYKGLPIYRWYRRNIKGQFYMQPPPRLFCIDKHGRFNVNNPCPVCRDEYLFFDFRNPALIEQFLKSGTHQPLEMLKTGLCREQYGHLNAQLIKAKEHGLIPFGVEFRNYDFRVHYPWWKKAPGEAVERAGVQLEDIHADPLVAFPAHRPDGKTDWDQWWLRDEKFSRKAK